MTNMFFLANRFKNEILDSEIDINSSNIMQEHNGVITVTAKLKPVRFVFAAFFVLPCLYLLKYVLGNPSILNLAVSFVFCPVMVFMALLIGGTIAAKSIDRYRQKTTKSLRLFSFATEVVEPLASTGVVTLTWKRSKAGNQSKGYSKFTITIRPGKGLVFVTFDDYHTAQAFAHRLAGFLSFPLENSVPQSNRV